MRKKIPLSVPQRPWQTPFSELSKDGLPEGSIAEPSAAAKKKFRLVLRREKARRGGKTVVVVTQFPTHLTPEDINNLARDLRRSLGCGGSERPREIEIQGDQPERVRRYFEERGYEIAGP
jgi:translation initiation factor 1